MAYATQIILGFSFSNRKLFENVCNDLSLKINKKIFSKLDGNLELHDESDLDDIIKIPKKLQRKIEKIQYQSLVDLNFTPISKNEYIKPNPQIYKDNYYYYFETPLGGRSFSKINLSHFYNSEFEKLNDYILGIPLTYRYSPVFLDWQDPHGGCPILILDSKFKKEISIIKNNLIKEFPIFRKSAVVVKETEF